jgi:hypothetical protein
LELTGFDGAPRFLGIDGQGREVLSYVPGQAALRPYQRWALSDDALVSVARLVRRYHDAVSTFDPASYPWQRELPQRFRGDVVCHNDLNLDNVVFFGGMAVALIDFDLASPGCVGWDLAGCVRLWAPLESDPLRPISDNRALERLALFTEAYGATSSQREELLDAILPCHDWCFDVVRDAVDAGHEVFTQEWAGGGSERASRARSWLATHRLEMRRALGLDVSEA